MQQLLRAAHERKERTVRDDCLLLLTPELKTAEPLKALPFFYHPTPGGLFSVPVR